MSRRWLVALVLVILIGFGEGWLKRAVTRTERELGIVLKLLILGRQGALSLRRLGDGAEIGRSRPIPLLAFLSSAQPVHFGKVAVIADGRTVVALRSDLYLRSWRR